MHNEGLTLKDTNNSAAIRASLDSFNEKYGENNASIEEFMEAHPRKKGPGTGPGTSKGPIADDFDTILLKILEKSMQSKSDSSEIKASDTIIDATNRTVLLYDKMSEIESNNKLPQQVKESMIAKIQEEITSLEAKYFS